MGRAIVRDPQVFLFDEPLSNLDAKLRVQMRTEIKELHQRLKTTTVYVTHDQIEAMTMADKIVVMHDGIVEQIGAPLELYDRPANLFVAGFIGSPAMNFLKGTIAGGAPASTSEGGVRLPIGPAPGRCRRPGRPCSASGPSISRSTPNGLTAEVVVVEPTGSETQVVVRCGGRRSSACSASASLRSRARPSASRPTPRTHLFERPASVSDLEPARQQGLRDMLTTIQDGEPAAEEPRLTSRFRRPKGQPIREERQ